MNIKCIMNNGILEIICGKMPSSFFNYLFPYENPSSTLFVTGSNARRLSIKKKIN